MLLKDNQLSTVLLLFALGFLIYYLSRPSEKRTANRIDPFTNVASGAATTGSGSVTTGTGTGTGTGSGVASASSTTASSTTASSTASAAPVSAAPVAAAPVTPVTPSTPSVPSAYSPSGGESSVSGMAGPSQTRPVNLPSDTIFNYQPSDSSSAGAGLDEAFSRPLPPGARIDVVDINKNNVTKYDAKDFLPKEINNQWFDTDFSQAKFNVKDDKLINTERYVVGINTVGQSLKNASYDIRGTIPNPKFSVSPWNNSTIEPDYNIKPLC